MFSKACQYGIRASIYIARQSLQKRRVSLKEVAEAIGSPTAYTSKILQKLAHQQIIDSYKGPSGGFSMNTMEVERVKLSDIVNAIDGEHLFNDCGLGLRVCNEAKPCPIHKEYKEITGKLKDMLETTLIESLANDFKIGLVFLKW